MAAKRQPRSILPGLVDSGDKIGFSVHRGDLHIVPLVLERPDESLDANATPAPEVRWVFPNYSSAALAEFLRSCELTGAQRSALLDTNRWQAATNGWFIFPPLEADDARPVMARGGLLLTK